MVHHNTPGELHRRRQILQQPEGDQRQALGGGGEKQQRDGGDRTGQHHQRDMRRPVIGEVTVAIELPYHQVDQGERRGQRGLDSDADPRVGSNGFLDRTVRAEGQRQADTDPRHAADPG